jgi:carbamoyltransferase
MTAVPFPAERRVEHAGRADAVGAAAIGISGTRRNAAAALVEDGVLVAACEQERMTRVRGARLEAGELPEAAVAAVLAYGRAGCRSGDARYVTAEHDATLPPGLAVSRLGHHFAHAASAFYTSPFDECAVFVCDRSAAPPMSAWTAGPRGLVGHPWADGATGFATLYSECSEVFGFGAGQEHRLEALARLDTGDQAGRLEQYITYNDGRLAASPGWRTLVCDWLASAPGRNGLQHRASVASAFQRHLGRLLLELLCDLRSKTARPTLSLAGGLFYNTYFTTLVRKAGIFDEVCVAPNPGNAGIAAGAALAVGGGNDGRTPRAVSPFLGPGYDLQQIKHTLENCKLSYKYLRDDEVIARTVDALQRGQLVGWFQGRMEWGHRALGNRSILANPVFPSVLDNLNGFLKQRESHRAYGVSVPEQHASRFFAGPPASRFMEYDYQICDRETFRHLLPAGVSRIRVQTIPHDNDEARRFHRLHEAFGETTGLPVLVNTSFNGFSEPIVCSPRDAVRVFFGTGLDLLVLDRFLISK